MKSSGFFQNRPYLTPGWRKPKAGGNYRHDNFPKNSWPDFSAVLLLLFIVALSDTRPSQTRNNLETATFAGGCFWCMEPPFDALTGVISTTSGYTGGKTGNPRYEEVSAGTGHAEAVQIKYDPSKISYSRLLQVFWHNIDPTAVNRQFCDSGNQYRTAIFYHNETQKKLALESKQLLEKIRHSSQSLQKLLRQANSIPRKLSPGLLPEKPATVQILPVFLRTGQTTQNCGKQRGGTEKIYRKDNN
jgi:peptide-methionine (S)-S-oxide reductase